MPFGTVPVCVGSTGYFYESLIISLKKNNKIHHLANRFLTFSCKQVPNLISDFLWKFSVRIITQRSLSTARISRMKTTQVYGGLNAYFTIIYFVFFFFHLGLKLNDGRSLCVWSKNKIIKYNGIKNSPMPNRYFPSYALLLKPSRPYKKKFLIFFCVSFALRLFLFFLIILYFFQRHSAFIPATLFTTSGKLLEKKK